MSVIDEAKIVKEELDLNNEYEDEEDSDEGHQESFRQAEA